MNQTKEEIVKQNILSYAAKLANLIFDQRDVKERVTLTRDELAGMLALSAKLTLEREQ